MHAIHQLKKFRIHFLIAALLCGCNFLIIQRRLHAQILHFCEPLIEFGDLGKSFQYFRAERHFHGRQGEIDIGVIVLESPVRTVGVVPVLDAQTSRQALPGSTLYVSGYGLTDQDSDAAGVLYIAATPFTHLAEAEFVAGGPDHPDTCKGDSGGPAFVRMADGGWRTWGIVSTGTSCGSAVN